MKGLLEEKVDTNYLLNLIRVYRAERYLENKSMVGVNLTEDKILDMVEATLSKLAAPAHDRSRDADGNPRVLWISKEAIALTLEDCKEGEGVMYVLSALDCRKETK